MIRDTQMHCGKKKAQKMEEKTQVRHETQESRYIMSMIAEVMCTAGVAMTL